MSKVILYKENPNLEYEIVTTESGEKEYRRNCKYLKGKYYRKDDEIFYLEYNERMQWVRKSSGKVEKDWETNTWHVTGTKRGLIKGVVAIENGQPITGLFSINKYNNTIVATSMDNNKCINSDILQANGYFECVQNGIWYKRSEVGDSNYRALTTIKPCQSFSNRGYNIEDNAVDFDAKQRSYAEYNLPISAEAKTYGKFLENLTFGVELECSMGAAPDWVQNRHGLVACKDGSLTDHSYTAPEYVSVPMSGAKGLQNLICIGNELSKRCNIDLSCSYHIHIGTIPRTRVYLVSLYMLILQIQDDMLKMFPYYKTDHRGAKRKNYCQKLRNLSIHPLKDASQENYDQFIEMIWHRIFEFLSDGHAADSQYNADNARHPIEQKFNRESRYFCANLQGMLFSQRRTCEHRTHEASLNPQKLSNWLFICAAINKFAEYNMRRIITGEKITFIDVLNHYKNHFKGDTDAVFLSDYLIAYYNERVAIFANDMKNGDKLSEGSLENDKKYKFIYNKKALFVN